MDTAYCSRCATHVTPSPAGTCPACGLALEETDSAYVGSTQSLIGVECPADEELRAFLHDELSTSRNDQIDSHVEECERCEQRLAALSDNTDEGEFDQSPQTKNSPPDDIMPQRIGKYEISELLGEGAFGRVFRARDANLVDREVAIKVLKRVVTDRDGQRILPDDEWQARNVAFREEARILLELDHPHIVRTFEFDDLDDGRSFIVSKFIDGCSLAQRMADDPLPHEQAVELVATVADALHHAHTHRLVHRDIKPANILLDEDEHPYIVDFGLALSDADYGSLAAMQGGTPAYMSPEQARMEGHLVDNRSDIFSLGVVLYELLTGERPFRGSSKQELLDRICKIPARPLRVLDDSISKELERICLQALSKVVEDRHKTALDFAEELRLAIRQPVVDIKQPVQRDESSGPVGALPTGKDPDDETQPAAARPKIVPKGLRSFDQGDADFFLELLPGPFDRFGLPKSIRFWKQRIEQTDADKTFRVGLLYGPSGCGKSSLVKAGLLPRLADHVQQVFLEASADDTEKELLRELRKVCPRIPAELNLVQAMAALRRGQGLPAKKKVCIVLDQFEQWLNAKRGMQNTEMVQALRHCDGQHVQCIVMIREDFWTATTRFMRELEILVLQDENTAEVDLFDPLHARKVLAEFGLAMAVCQIRIPRAVSRNSKRSSLIAPPRGSWRTTESSR